MPSPLFAPVLIESKDNNILYSLEWEKARLPVRDKTERFEIRLEKMKRADMQILRLTLQNIKEERLFLYIWQVEDVPQGSILWDGLQMHIVNGKDIYSDDIKGRFPLSCVWSKESGIAVGILPHQRFSSFLTRKKGNKFYFGIRLSIEPKTTEVIQFVRYFFPADLGYLRALDFYYNFFPEIFTTSKSMEYANLHAFADKFFSIQEYEETKNTFKSLLADNIDGFLYQYSEIEKHRGEALEKIYGKSFDAEGSYVMSDVRVSLFFDFLRRLKKNKQTVTLNTQLLSTNKVPSYLIPFYSDGIVFRGHFYKNIKDYEEKLRKTRLLLGSKPITLNIPAEEDDIGEYVRWEIMDPEDIIALFRAIENNMLEMCFKWGAIPDEDFASGRMKTLRYLPVLEYIVHSGWQAIPAISIDKNYKQEASAGQKKIWFSRYGRDIDTTLCVGWIKDRKSLQVQNIDIGVYDYVFADIFSKQTKNIVENSKTGISFPISTEHILPEQIKKEQISVIKPILGFPRGTNVIASVDISVQEESGFFSVVADITCSIQIRETTRAVVGKMFGASDISVFIDNKKLPKTNISIGDRKEVSFILEPKKTHMIRIIWKNVPVFEKKQGMEQIQTQNIKNQQTYLMLKKAGLTEKPLLQEVLP